MPYTTTSLHLVDTENPASTVELLLTTSDKSGLIDRIKQLRLNSLPDCIRENALFINLFENEQVDQPVTKRTLFDLATDLCQFAHYLQTSWRHTCYPAKIWQDLFDELDKAAHVLELFTNDSETPTALTNTTSR